MVPDMRCYRATTAKKVRETLGAGGHTLADLAAHLGETHDTALALLNGEQALNLDQIGGLAEWFGVHPVELIDPS